MQQVIKYKGISLAPDEMAAENGALSLCGNVELHDGALRPAIISGTYIAEPIPKNTKLVYVHEGSGYKHFIGVHQVDANEPQANDITYALQWFDEDGTFMEDIHEFSSGITISSVSSVGNTLVIIASDGLHYALFKKDNSAYGNYLYLGEKPPFLELGFVTDIMDKYENYDLGGVSGEGSTDGFNVCFQQTTYGCSDIFEAVDGTAWKRADPCVNIKEDKQSDITQSIYALVNRTNNLIARQGRFYANFFVRYCYRMFDGSMIMHSSPVFIPVQVPNNYSVDSVNVYFPLSSCVEDGTYMIKNTKVFWQDKITFNRTDGAGKSLAVNITKAAFQYSPRNVALRYSLRGNVEELKKWNDIIKSVDVFITPPITNIDTSDKISHLSIRTSNYGIGRGTVGAPLWQSDNLPYYDAKGKCIIGYAQVDFPTLSDEAYQNKLKNTSAFYKVCSLKVSEIKETTLADLPVDKSQVYQISLQEQMKDDYKTHNKLFASGCYVYNHRLNLYGVKERLMEGFSRMVMFPKATYLRSSGDFAKKLHVTKIVTILNTTSGTKYVEKIIDGKITDYIEGYMLANLVKFYPDSRAEKMVFFCKDGNNEESLYAFDLEACEELNGAMQMGDFADELSKYKIDSLEYSVDDTVDLSNKIYTSESDNGFYFPVNSINTVGIGAIKGIASTTRALSQGQFGQYPLMAFSTDGIWALNVSASGTYSSIHPISREVCSNPSAITQLDQSVAFVTNRSFNRVAESQVIPMSDMLEGPGFDILTHLDHFLSFFEDKDNDTNDVKEEKAQVRKLIEFSESPIDFFQHCQVVYDYKNSRLLCIDVTEKGKIPSSDTVALCYSIRDGAWSTFLIKNVNTVINSYPHPYIQFENGYVLCLDKGYDYADQNEYHGIVVTRTLKFDEDECPDSVTGYIHSLTSNTVPVLWIYGSNDNQNWHYLGRCGGMKAHYMSSKSYRYFRLAIYLKMKSISQYFSTRLEIIRRFGKI